MTDDNIENIKKELKELKEQELIMGFKLNDMRLERIEFEIFTLEGNVLKIETNTNHCYKIINLKDDFLYESFEQILFKYSKDYSKKFNDLINNELFELINENQNEEN